MIKDNYQLLVEKLDQFIRKYYVNQLIRGGLYSVALILAIFIAFNVLEYNFYFSTSVRKVLFFSFLGVNATALTAWVALPLLHYFQLGSVISHEQAAQIIGSHFGNVKDKLLNILQLKKQSYSSAQAELINASIQQKTTELSPVPFKTAIDFSQNKKYLRYALPPLALLLFLFWWAPNIIREGSKRLIQNNKEFERAAPFRFVVNKDSLRVVQFGDFKLQVRAEGDVLPNEMFIDVDKVQYRLTKESADVFSYQFNNVQKETDFKLAAGGFGSEPFRLDVLKKPNIEGFAVKLNYPDYTERKDEELENIGDLVLPQGTEITWAFNAKNTDQVTLQFENGAAQGTKKFGDDLFSFERKAATNERYRVFISNKNLPRADSVAYSLSVVPDLHPTINVEKFTDSTSAAAGKVFFFAGDAADDYGLRSLSFNYRVKDAGGKEGQSVSVPLQKPAGKQIQYKHTFDVRDLNLKPGEEVTYYFEVFDNDGVNGSKSSRTTLMNYRLPSAEEFQKIEQQNNDEIKKDLETALKESKKVQEELKRLREKLLQQKEMDWQTRKELEKLLARQKELDKQIEDAKKNFQENLKNQQEFSKPDEKLLEKQEKLEKLFNELQNDETKKLMMQIQEMLQKLEKDQALEKMENMKLNNDEMHMEMDRMLELFKQLEMEQKQQETIEKLQEMAKQQEELSKDTDKSEKPQEQLEKKQEELNKKFEDLKKDLKDLEKKNQDLENKKDLGLDKEKEKEAEQNMKESQQDMKQKENKKAAKKQKKAAENMKDMANSMQQKKESEEQEQAEEDLKAMRQLLENLVGLSFDQEKVMSDFNATPINTPRYVELIQRQYKLKDDFGLIKDSLQALSKRVVQIESFVTEKISEITGNMEGGLKHLEERQKSEAADQQQRTMKNVNDLALMLSESMDQMQQQASSSKPGSGSCKKPGGKNPNGKGGKGKVPMDKITQGQKELNEDMKKMGQGMKGGKSGKDGKEGKEGGKDGGKDGSSQEFAKMAAKQSALRRALREIQQDKQEKGQGDKSLQELQDMMDKVETELVNKRLSNETMKRQEDILTRLLEAERAEREREYDNKRKAAVAHEVERKMPPSLEEYLKKREAEIETYKTVSPSLKPFYKNLVEEYYKTLKK